jgi:hypothetical protein
MDDEFISVSEIARIHGRHKSVVHKIIDRLGITTTSISSADARGQIAKHISTTDYQRLIVELDVVRPIADQAEDALSPGSFYLVQLEPECDPGRFKLGFATDVNQRLRSHKTVAPFAVVIRTWPCRALWEKTAIDSISRGCDRLYTEVFRTSDLAVVVSAADSFFAQMPRMGDDGSE